MSPDDRRTADESSDAVQAGATDADQAGATDADQAGATDADQARAADESSDADDPGAAYVFGVRFRVEPAADQVWLDPSTFETTVYRRADPPGEPGWRYFRDNLWRGECGDAEHMRELTEEGLGNPVESVEFRELRTSQAYLDDLREAIESDLDAFNATTTDEVLSKYLGSSIRVVDVADLDAT